MATLNRTNAFYEADDPSLLWELTVCQSIGMGSGGYARALREPAAYGVLLARRLRQLGLPATPGYVIEIGGGWGTLMRGFLSEIRPRRLTMVDLSAALLARQQEALSAAAVDATFIQADALDFLADLTEPADLVIANEIIGDLPTLTGISASQLAPHIARAGSVNDNEDPLLAEAARLITAYDLDTTDLPDPFNLNLGALQLIEALAATPVRRAFISEHGADTELPYPFAAVQRQYHRADKNPRRIPLKDHDEYTIRFDHLEAAARRLGFAVTREHMMDMLDVRFDDEINYLLSGGRPRADAQEMLLEFLEHVAEYQVLYLQRPAG